MNLLRRSKPKPKDHGIYLSYMPETGQYVCEQCFAVFASIEDGLVHWCTPKIRTPGFLRRLVWKYFGKWIASRK